MNSLLPGLDIISGFIPVNLAAGANTGVRVKMDRGAKLVIVLHKDAAGAGAEDPTVTVLQHTAVSAGSYKALNFTEFWYKAETTLAGDTAWTLVSQSAANTATVSGIDEKEVILAIEIDAEDLDRSNGYYWVSANVADTGDNAQIGGLLYLMSGRRLQDDT